MLRLLLWEASSASMNSRLLLVHTGLADDISIDTTCPVAMTDGAARLLQLQLRKWSLDETHRAVFQNAYDHLTSRDPEHAWTSGQWMTERPGGSDVSQTETVATYTPYNDPILKADTTENIPLGPWSISGFKWFSSATDSSMTILLAQTKPGKGVSAFFAPMRRYNPNLVSHLGEKGDMELNGVRISRLKDKMGTKSLPTAELELHDMRGWLIGEEGKGIQEIASILTITRIHSSIGALGYLGRGLAVAKAYAIAREIGATRGKRIPLYKSPLHVRTLANMTSEYHAMMLLVFYSTTLLGLDEQPVSSLDGSKPSSSGGDTPLQALTPPPQHVQPLLRVLSSLQKSYCCQKAIPTMYGCMEALGGLGYLNNTESEALNLSRIFRDLCVLATWEGTTNVLAADTLRALKHPRSGAASLEALDWLFNTGAAVERKAAARALTAWRQLKKQLEETNETALLADARDIIFRLAELLMASLLAADASYGDDPRSNAILGRFLKTTGLVDLEAEAEAGKADPFEVDTVIVFGDDQKDLKPSSKL